jgi:hypothetical protein
LRRRSFQWWRGAARDGLEVACVLADGDGAGPLDAGAGGDAAVVVVVETCAVVVGGWGAGVVLVSVAVAVVLVACDVVLLVVVLLAVVVVAELGVPGSAAVAAAAEPSACNGTAPAISAAIVAAVDRGISIWWHKTCGGVQTFPDSGVG